MANLTKQAMQARVLMSEHIAKKITRTTIKSFIKREEKNGNLYVKVKSSFDGMIDCVSQVEDEFRKVENVDFSKEYDFDIKGLWLVGSSRDYFTEFADDNYIGYKISNCCGVSIIAMKRLY